MTGQYMIRWRTTMSSTPIQDAFGRMADQIYCDTIESAVIGTDGHGYTHTWHQPQDTVVVHYGTDVDVVHRLDGRPLDHWVRHVRDLRGWEEVGPHGDRLIDADRRLKESQQ